MTADFHRQRFGPDDRRKSINPEILKLEILKEDDHIVAVVKPAGLPTANAAKGCQSVFTILQRDRPVGAFVGVVSRLDAPVSGVLVMAKTRAAAAELSRQFRERLVEKRYCALVEGRFPAPVGVWVDWTDTLERQGQERRSRLFPGPGGRTADGDQHASNDHGDQSLEEASWAGKGEGAGREPGGGCHLRGRVLQRRGEISLVELVPTTGRRHQLRAQLSGRGCPIVGDRTYGARLPFPSNPGFGAAIALHARRLAFAHPGTRLPIVLEAGWPAAWVSRFPGLDRAVQDGGSGKDF